MELLTTQPVAQWVDAQALHANQATLFRRASTRHNDKKAATVDMTTSALLNSYRSIQPAKQALGERQTRFAIQSPRPCLTTS